MALIQEPLYREDHIRGYEYSRIYSVVCRMDRPRACILARNMTIWMVPGFSCRDLVVVVKYENGAERWLVVCSTCLPYDSEDPPPSKEFEEILQYCESENLLSVHRV